MRTLRQQSLRITGWNHIAKPMCRIYMLMIQSSFAYDAPYEKFVVLTGLMVRFFKAIES